MDLFHGTDVVTLSPKTTYATTETPLCVLHYENYVVLSGDYHRYVVRLTTINSIIVYAPSSLFMLTKYKICIDAGCNQRWVYTKNPACALYQNGSLSNSVETYKMSRKSTVFNTFIKLTANKGQTFCIVGPLWAKEIPLTKGQFCGNCFHVMSSSCHHHILPNTYSSKSDCFISYLYLMMYAILILIML